MTEGLKFVEDNFGTEARPRVAWHIDPFGHSSEQAAIFARMGFDGFFFARIDYQDFAKRKNESKLEMIWRGSPNNLGMESDIFTGVLYNGYGPPPDMCFDVFCGDDAVEDDTELFTYNLEHKMMKFINDTLDQNKHYRTNNIMFTMGSDFQYQAAPVWYRNLDILIENINKKYGDRFNLFYSTPTRYVDAVHAAGLTWSVKTDDFFPYADCPWCYWSGYFTSRPALKGYVREMNSFLQTCRHFEQYVGGPGQSGMTSDKLAQAMGVAQHHDAVSGTEKQHVADDYAMRLHIGQVQCQSIIGASLNKYVPKEGSGPLTWEFCEYLNISVCPQSQSGSFNVLIYNPLVHSRDVYVRVPVATRNLEVMDGKGSMVPYDIAEVTTATKEVRGKKGDAPYNLFFIASTQSLSYTTYFIRAAKNSSLPKKVSKRQPPPPEPIISNDYLQVVFAQDTGHVRSISNMKKDITVMLNQQFFYYNASTGNKASHQASGAYIFRPNSSRLFYVNEDDNRAEVTVVNGKTYQEVQQVFSDYASQVVRLYKGANFVEFEYTIGPIPFSDGLGKEIISRFDTDLASSGMWYTDANGREMQERIRNHRNTWTLNNTEPVAGNYYPVNSRISIQDKTKRVQFTVLTDRSQGGSSLKDGSVELMVHRRLQHDDGRGVGEPLNETGQFGTGLIIRGRHWVVLDTVEESAAIHRILGEQLLLRPTLVFHQDSTPVSEYTRKYNTEYSFSSGSSLPTNVHLLTLQHWEERKVLLRFEHLFEKGEDGELSKPAVIDLNDKIFQYLELSTLTELGLAANVKLEDIKRLSWKTEGEPLPKIQERGVKLTNITLNPMEIRTFEVEYKQE